MERVRRLGGEEKCRNEGKKWKREARAKEGSVRNKRM